MYIATVWSETIVNHKRVVVFLNYDEYTYLHYLTQRSRRVFYASLFYYYYYCSTTLCWALAAFSVTWSYTHSVELLGRGISHFQGLYLYTEQHKYRINAHNTDIHALSGIRTHDPSFRANEDSSWLRPRGYCNWLTYLLRQWKLSPTHVVTVTNKHILLQYIHV
jgi:hypothetical protein